MRMSEPKSYRADPAVPAFDDSRPIAFMDGECALCTGAARLIARMDRTGTVRICPTGTPLGRAVLEHYGLSPDDPDTWLWLQDGRAYEGMDGVVRAGRTLGGAGRVLVALLVLPRPARAWLYRRLARNRYALFGRADMCGVPDPALRARLLT